jgi:hypothetical protein
VSLATPTPTCSVPPQTTCRFAIFFWDIASSEKRLQGGRRAVVRQRTSQWLPRKVPVGGDPPPQKKKKDSARRATLLLFFLRRALEGMARYVVQIPWIGSLHTRHIVNGCKSFSHWLSSMSSLPLQFRTTSLADVESSHMRMKAATLAVCIRSST